MKGKITLGIDFGTCYSCGAYFKDGILVPVKDTSGGSYQSTIPSAVFIESDGSRVVGQGAINLLAQDPESFFSEFKRSLGSGRGHFYRSKRIATRELVAEVLKKVKMEAEKNEDKIEDAVITVPATYNQVKRDLMLKAAKETGFKNIELITEPVAAALYWQHKNREKLKDGDITLVYDLGGGTFDTVLVKKQGDIFQYIGNPAGDDAIGGLAFDGKVLEDLNHKCAAVQRFMDEKSCGVDQEALRLRFGQALLDFCREFKHRLSERETWSNFLPLAFGGMDRYTLSRENDFNGMIKRDIDRTITICDAVVKEAGLSWNDVERILLVGGSTRIPYVGETLGKRFGRPVVRCDEPDMAVCYGAALYEGSKIPNIKVLVEDLQCVLRHQMAVTIPNNMVLVEGGSFQMGDTFGDGKSNEKPVHKVTLRSFYMSKYEVTFDEYDAYIGKGNVSDNRWGRGQRPVINVNWYDAVAYCNWRSAKEGLQQVYSGSGDNVRCDFRANGYRLPTEAEWEYAAKGGKQSNGYRYSGSDNVNDVAWYDKNSNGMTQLVGQKQANELGIYDMSGNVMEWCWDWDEHYYSYQRGDSDNPLGASSGIDRVFRGGSWDDVARNVRSAFRLGETPGFNRNYLGFRLLRTL